MQKIFMLMSFSAIMGLSSTAIAGESQNPHDAVNQPIEESQNPHDAINQPGPAGTGTGTATGTAGAELDAATPNPNSFGRTGRFDELDAQNARRNSGIQTAPDTDNLDDRIEDINNDDRQLSDRLDGSPVPTADPNLNSERAGDAPPLPPGQGPAVDSNTGSDNTSVIRSDTGAGGTSGATSTSGSSSTSGSGAASGSGSAAGSGSTSSSSSGGAN